ncbi:MAG: HAMP domain-containing sensor histidine kinase [Candidatus Omnitrophota bacterium]
MNILIVSCAVLFLATFLVSTYQYFALPKYRGSSPLFFLFFVFLFGGLYWLSKRNKSKIAAHLFLGLFFILPTYAIFQWGADVVAGLLFYVLVIIMSGILIGSRVAFVVMGLSSFFITLVAYLQTSKIINPISYWKAEPFKVVDTVLVSIIFLIIATVTWISTREVQKSLSRVRESEAELKKERDSLEIKVEDRTKELKEVQAEKMSQLYRFAEFGRISSGLFHDLINPLNAVSLNLGKTDGTAEETKQYVGNAVRAAKKLEDLVVAVRRQLAREETKALFLVEEEIKHVIEVLSHKAQNANVDLRFIPSSDIQMFGDAIKFNQVVLNLVANGIDACMPPTAELVPVNPGARWVQISLIDEPETMIMLVEDNGVGIPEHHMDKIFEPFFTTKINGQGIGIGLSMAKRIVEKDFGGLLTAKSEAGRGSSFKVSLPVRKQATEYAA